MQQEHDFLNHRHIDVDVSKGLSLEAIDEIIDRGDMYAWLKLRDYINEHPEVLDDIIKLCKNYISDPLQKAYILWYRFALFKKGEEIDFNLL